MWPLARPRQPAVLASSNLVYTISVTNFGPSSASGVVVTDALPATVTFVSATGGGLNNSGIVNWNLGTLTNGQTSNVTVTVTAPATGSLTNVASVSTPTGDPNLTNNLGHHDGHSSGRCGHWQDPAAGGQQQSGLHISVFGPSSASGVVVPTACQPLSPS
jgi:uncharacterized repeat protein (TIGR01451 family)